jgi:hypothetical protein
MKINIVSILVGVTLVCLLGLPALVDLSPIIAVENGLLENTQVVLLALSFAGFLLPVRRAGRESRCILLGGALLALTCILREVDVEDLNVARWIVLMGSGIGRNTIFFALWAGVLFYTIKIIPQLKEDFLRITGSNFGKLIISAGIAMLIGDLFDKDILGIGQAQIYEEFYETIGYMLLLIATFNTYFPSVQNDINYEPLALSFKQQALVT